MDSAFDHFSICAVNPKNINGQSWLTRLADIREDTILPFIVNNDMPHYFENRERLFQKDGPEDVGFIGVWWWAATQNDKDPNKDHIDSKFLCDCQPVRVLVVSGANSEEQLLDKMQAGFLFDSHSQKVLLSYVESKGQYIGFLCQSKDFTITDDTFRLNEDVFLLPAYQFTADDMIGLNGCLYLRSINLGSPIKEVSVKLPTEIVKSVVLQKASWSSLKAKGLTKKEWRDVRDFLDSIDGTPMQEEIAEKCKCDIETAQKYIKEFIDNANNYIDGNDFDTNVLASIVESHPELMRRCESIVEKSWKSENEAILESANQRLSDVRAAALEQEQKHSKLLEELNIAEKKLKDISEKTIKQEQFSIEVEQKVRTRIESARADAAGFISEMMFANPTSFQTANQVAKNHFPVITKSAWIAQNAEKFETQNDFIEIFNSELLEAGVAEKATPAVSAYIYAAYCNHIPLILAGPNGDSIVDALSASLYGQTASKIECSQIPFAEAMAAIEDSDDDIFILIDPLQANWINHLPELLSRSTKQLYSVSPFSEDLCIEPRSLYNYVMPLLTELIIDKAPGRNFVGGKMGNQYSHYKPQKAEAIHSRKIQRLTMTLLQRSRAQQMLTDAHKILGNSSAEIDYTMALFPFAFVTNQTDSILEIMKTDDSLPKESLKAITSFVGEEE